MLTQAQLDQRRTSLGATDVVKLLRGDALPVWQSKVYGEVAEPLADNDPRSIGSLLEPAVLGYAANKLGAIKFGVRAAATDCPIVASLDGQLIATGEPVEAKTSGILWSANGDQWGDDGTDDIPEAYIIQVHAQLIATNTSKAHVVALIGGRGFAMYTVHRNEALADYIRDKSRQFWAQHVETQTAPTPADWPDLQGPTMEVLKRIRRQPGKTIELAKPHIKVVDRWRKIKDALNAFGDCVEEAEAQAVALLGDAEAGTLPDGRQFTYLERTRSGIDVAALRNAHPEVAAEFAKVSRFRVADVK